MVLNNVSLKGKRVEFIVGRRKSVAARVFLTLCLLSVLMLVEKELKMTLHRRVGNELSFKTFIKTILG